LSDGFTDSLEGNYEILRDMLKQLPPQGRARAKSAYATIESAMNSLRVNGGENDPAVTLGLAMAGYAIARALTQDEEAAGGLIKLLS
jgi:hypothetical protein